MVGLAGTLSDNYNEEKIFEIVKSLNYSISETKYNRQCILFSLDVKSKQTQEKIVEENEDISIVTCGKIYNEENYNLKQLLLTMYKTGDWNKLKNLNGPFAAAIYDSKMEKLTIVNDRFGLIKIFYFKNEKNFFFGPKIMPLLQLGAKKVLRKDAIIDFFLFRYLLTNKTFFEDLYLLPGASILEVTKNNIKLSNYWDYKYDIDYDKRPKEILIDELKTLWEKAVEKRIKKDEKIIIPISGGLDSRAILAAALKCTAKENIITYSFGEKHSFDFIFGKKVAKKVHVKHISMVAEKENFQERYNSSIKDNEGMIDVTPFFPIEKLKNLEKHQSTILTGYMGGEIMGPLIFPKLIDKKIQSEEDYNAIKNIIFDHYSLNNFNDIQGLLTSSFFESIDLLTSFNNSLEGIQTISEREAVNFCAAWMYKNESAKYTYFCIFRYKNIFSYSPPFLDNELVDFMLRMPPEFRINKNLYTTMLLQNYPELFTLPLRTSVIELNNIKNKKLSQVSLLSLMSIFNRLSEKLINRKILIDKRDLNYIDYDELLRRNKAFKSYVKTIIEKVSERGYFNKKYIDFLWEQHMQNKKNCATIFGQLVTFELFLENFYDEEFI